MPAAVPICIGGMAVELRVVARAVPVGGVVMVSEVRAVGIVAWLMQPQPMLTRIRVPCHARWLILVPVIPVAIPITVSAGTITLVILLAIPKVSYMAPMPGAAPMGSNGRTPTVRSIGRGRTSVQ